MLSRIHRISTRQFDAIVGLGRAYHSPHFTMRVMLVDVPEIRLAAVYPKKLAKLAVERNRVRRRIYEAIKPLIGEVRSSAHIIMIAKKPASEATIQIIRTDAATLFAKAGLMR